jgi:hypothetical protein
MTTIETYRAFGLCALLATGALTIGCSDSNAGGGSAGKGGSSGSATTTSGSTTSGSTTSGSTTSGSTTTTGAGGTGGGGKAVTYCDPAKWATVEPQPITIDSCSDFDVEGGAEGIHCIMPGGVWAVDVDGAGTAKADSFVIEPCGTTGNGYHFKGTGHSVWGADAAAAIVSQVQPVDVSGYAGISFVMKSVAANALIFKVQNPYSQPPCGKCDDLVTGAECYSGYIKNVALPAGSAEPIVVKWSELAQQGWGYKAPGTAMFDAANLISVAFAFDKGIDFDVCIDDVKFIH